MELSLQEELIGAFDTYKKILAQKSRDKLGFFTN